MSPFHEIDVAQKERPLNRIQSRASDIQVAVMLLRLRIGMRCLRFIRYSCIDQDLRTESKDLRTEIDINVV